MSAGDMSIPERYDQRKILEKLLSELFSAGRNGLDKAAISRII
jgi:hypothetical protein